MNTSQADKARLYHLHIAKKGTGANASASTVEIRNFMHLPALVTAFWSSVVSPGTGTRPCTSMVTSYHKPRTSSDTDCMPIMSHMNTTSCEQRWHGKKGFKFGGPEKERNKGNYITLQAQARVDGTCYYHQFWKCFYFCAREGNPKLDAQGSRSDGEACHKQKTYLQTSEAQNFKPLGKSPQGPSSCVQLRTAVERKRGKRKLRRQRRLCLHQLRKKRHIGSEDP
eukprot:1159970-Pelagomonas_calceolata.AAC.12